MNDILQIAPVPGFEPEIGRWLWSLEEVRRRTLRLVEGLEQPVLDWTGAGGSENSIGTLLYHIALVEMSWLFEDIQERDLPDYVKADFLYPMGNSAGGITAVPGVPLAEHLARLERSRAVFLAEMRGMSLEDWRRFRTPADFKYRVTPEWAVFHLVEHEAGHAFQIASLRRRATRALRQDPGA